MIALTGPISAPEAVLCRSGKQNEVVYQLENFSTYLLANFAGSRSSPRGGQKVLDLAQVPSRTVKELSPLSAWHFFSLACFSVVKLIVRKQTTSLRNAEARVFRQSKTNGWSSET
jgi:hypothetical protein